MEVVSTEITRIQPPSLSLQLHITAVPELNDDEMTQSEPSEAALRALLARDATPTSTGTDVEALTESDVRLLAESLVPGQSRSVHSLAYLTLSKLVSSAAQSSTDPKWQDAITVYVEAVFLQDSEQVEPTTFVPFAALLGALFPLDPATSKQVLEHRLSDISTDATAIDDPLAVLLETAELPSPLQPVLADMLSQAAGTKLGRELIRSRAQEWLEGAVKISSDPELAAVCAVALSKLRQEVLPEQQEGQEQEQDRDGDMLEMCDRMVTALRRGADASAAATMSSVEGLAILSSRPIVKDRLASDRPFLDALIALSPIPKPRGGSLPITPRASMDVPLEPAGLADAGLCYGITTILVNLTNPKPILSAEDEQVAKLRAMAISGKRNTNTVATDDPPESAEAVRSRTRAVLAAGGTRSLTGLVRADSRTVKEGLAKLCLNLVESKEDRLAFVRDGGYKVLSTVLRDLATSTSKANKIDGPATASSTSTSTVPILYAAQALAKLVITTPPNLLFPPPLTTSCLDCLTPLYHLLCDPSSALLQQFEALMALTNLASIEPSIAGRIIDASITPHQQDGMWRGTGRDDTVLVLSKIEECLISDNLLIRRAATELICNLVSSQRGFDEYTSTSEKQGGRTESRLRLLLILSNSDDLPTRLATGGALAVLTDSPYACACLLRSGVSDDKERSAWSRIIGTFQPPDEIDEDTGESIPTISTSSSIPDEGSLHRAAVILHNLITYCTGLDEAERKKQFQRLRQDGAESTLMSLLRKDIGRDAIEPVVECLKLLKRYPA